jgi:hypothetical protein
MSKITLIVGAVLGLSVVSVLLLLWRSAEGHEDEKGFHPEADGKSPDARANDGEKVEPPKVALPGAATTPIEAKR